MEFSSQPHAIVLLLEKEVLHSLLNRRLGRRQSQSGGFEFITSKLILRRNKAEFNVKGKEGTEELH